MRGLVLHANWEPREDYVPSEVEVKTRKVKYGSRVWKDPQLKLEEIPVPEIRPKDVLIRVKACGICGSDVHMYQRDKDGYMLYPGLTRFPCIIGHELSGIIERVGEDVKDFKEGDMVTSEEMMWCGECVPCRNGIPNHCINLEEIGFTINGGFAEYLIVEAKYCWKIDSLLNVYKSEEKVFEAGSLVEPTSVAYHAIFTRAEGFKPGAYVVVYGDGPIGLASVALAKAAGATKVIVFGHHVERMKLAEEMGADYMFDPRELQKAGVRPYEKVMELTGGMGADLQVESAGAPAQSLPEMEKSLAIGGKITWIGRADVEAPIFLERFQVRASQVYGSQGHSGHGNFMSVIRLMAAGKIDMTKIITRRYSLDEAVDAIRQVTRKVDAKITIKP
ncbi:MAG: putative L-threonine 3-dehydrogenase [Candidatus Bathyarchaeota archaeon BA1]|nr:MAG: putative L-threonine 3-dehydrogenase [Candidatus Bathyarchaeota archaeon BA1]